MSNLYWPVYKNLENEIIELSFNVNFDDNQFKYQKDESGNYIKTPVYSIKIGDLLVRTCTEIEALIQELTKGKENEIQNLPNVDSNRPITSGCKLKYLHNIWGLNKKVVIVSCISMYFIEEENKCFSPFNYIKDGFDDYYSAYNAIKHNRNTNTILKGNIRYLLKAIGSLYLLNLYYKKESIYLGKNDSTSSIPTSSNLFAVESINASSTDNDNSIKLTYTHFKKATTAVYIVKPTDYSKSKENKIIEELSKLISNNLSILTSKYPEANIEDLKIEAIKMTPYSNLIKEFENSEYEAVLIKPEEISFYESVGCNEKYDKNQLEQIKKETELWKSKLDIN